MEARYRARITSKGQLTVPRQVRRLLGVDAGDEVAFEVGPNGVSVVPIRPASRFREYEGAWRKGDGMTTDEIDGWLRTIRGHDEVDR